MIFEERYFEACHGCNIYKSTILQWPEEKARLWIYADELSIHYLSIDTGSDVVKSTEIRIVEGADSNSSSQKIFGISSYKHFLYVICKVSHDRLASNAASSVQGPASSKQSGISKQVEKKFHVYVYDVSFSTSTFCIPPKLKLVQDMVLDYHPFDFQVFENIESKYDSSSSQDGASRNVFAALSSSGKTGIHIYEVDSANGRLCRSANRDLMKAYVDKCLKCGQQNSIALRLKFQSFPNALFLSAGFSDGCYSWSYSMEDSDFNYCVDSVSLSPLDTIVESVPLSTFNKGASSSSEQSLVMDGAVNVVQLLNLTGKLSNCLKLQDYVVLGLSCGAAVLTSLNTLTAPEQTYRLPGAYCHGAVQAIVTGDTNGNGISDIVSGRKFFNIIFILPPLFPPSNYFLLLIYLYYFRTIRFQIIGYEDGTIILAILLLDDSCVDSLTFVEGWRTQLPFPILVLEYGRLFQSLERGQECVYYVDQLAVLTSNSMHIFVCTSKS